MKLKITSHLALIANWYSKGVTGYAHYLKDMDDMKRDHDARIAYLKAGDGTA
jgi:hypothetical protein